MRFGEELRKERERRGISLDDVAVFTCVAPHHLHALEANQFGELPGGVFSRGIVRSYAQYCGLDADGTVQSFVAAMRASGMEPEPKEDDWMELAEAVHRNRPQSHLRRGLRWLGVFLMLVVVALLAAAVLWLLIHRGVLPMPDHLRSLAEKLARLSRRL